MAYNPLKRPCVKAPSHLVDTLLSFLRRPGNRQNGSPVSRPCRKRCQRNVAMTKSPINQRAELDELASDKGSSSTSGGVKNLFTMDHSRKNASAFRASWFTS